MKKLFLMLVLVLGMGLPGMAQEMSELAGKISDVVRVQGTVVGENIVSAAILDDQIVRVGDVLLVDEATGHLVTKLGASEIPQHPTHLKVKVVAIAHGNVVINHEDINLSLLAR